MIETERLNLARLEPEHVSGDFLRWINDAEVNLYLGSQACSFDESNLKAYIERVNSDPDTYLLGMFAQDDGRHVGNIKLGPVNAAHKRADIDLVVWKPEWGMGFATEAIVAAARFGFETLGLHKITAGCPSINRGSIRAFAKAGFVHEATRPNHCHYDGGWVDEWEFGCTASMLRG